MSALLTLLAALTPAHAADTDAELTLAEWSNRQHYKDLVHPYIAPTADRSGPNRDWFVVVTDHGTALQAEDFALHIGDDARAAELASLRRRFDRQRTGTIACIGAQLALLGGSLLAQDGDDYETGMVLAGASIGAGLGGLFGFALPAAGTMKKMKKAGYTRAEIEGYLAD